MIAVGEKNRPTVSLVLRDTNSVGYRACAAAVSIDAPDYTSGIRSINNHTPAAPTSSPRRLNVCQGLRCATYRCYFHQLAVSKKTQVRSVGRPEWKRRALGSRQGCGVR